MKNIKNIFAVVVFSMVVANAQAQTEEQIALSLTPSTSASCFHAGIKEGTPWSKKCGGLYVTLSGDMTSHSTSNNDGVSGTGTETTMGGQITLGNKWIRKNWKVAFRAEAFAGINSSFDVENRRVGSNFNLGVGGFVELFPHSPVHVDFGGEYEYRNLVSENTQQTPWRGNAHYYGPAVKVVVPIGSINVGKTVQVGNQRLNTIKKHEINLVVSGSYKWATVGKYWDGNSANKPELRDKMMTVSAGISVNLW